MDDIVEKQLAGLLEREGGYSDHPADRGGPTCFGITEVVARANGYHGPMRELPRHVAMDIYRRRYWREPGFDIIARRSEKIAGELFDTGVNMGAAVAIAFLQRALNALNRQGRDWHDIPPTRRVDPTTVAALDMMLAKRGMTGETVLLRAINCLQGARYIELAEMRPANEAFVYGWLRERVA